MAGGAYRAGGKAKHAGRTLIEEGGRRGKKRV
jgi:hypothetical protein